ncbi:MAG: hypothetical protein ACI8QS_001457 [Planctomycetota bacterium]|jgi:hypothetical protein
MNSRNSCPQADVLIGLVALICMPRLGQGQVTTSVGPVFDQDPTPVIQFEVATASAGMDGTYTQGNTHTGGSAWIDYNGDLLPDLFVTNGKNLPHYLFRNEGGGTFSDVSHLVPKPDIGTDSAGAIYGDIDNDGDYDLFVMVDSPEIVVVNQPVNPPEGGPNLLYLNNGDGTFAEVGASYGVVHPLDLRTICAGFADYDLDGFLDLYLGSWTPYSLPLGTQDDYDRLLHNDGDGTFTDVTTQYGTDGYGLDALCMLWLDTDFNLFPEFYLGNTAFTHSPPAFDTTDAFYRNNLGLSFTDEVTGELGFGHDAYAPMGIDAGDIDNDGDWDLYITDTQTTPPRPMGNALYLGNPDGTFGTNQAANAGVQSESSWPCGFADFDRDGWVDLWVGTLASTTGDRIYRNMHDGTFTQVIVPNFIPSRSRGGSYADYDGDGDMDLFDQNDKANSHLFENTTLTTSGWIEFKLYGQTSNRGAVGTVVRLSSDGLNQMRRVSGGDSAHSQSDSILHFGTGASSTVSATITWPSGAVQALPALVPGDIYLIDETAGLLSEVVSDAGITYDELSGTLTVVVSDTFGGRTSLSAVTHGDLTYDAASLTYTGSFGGLSVRPDNCTIASERGGNWTLPVN